MTNSQLARTAAPTRPWRVFMALVLLPLGAYATPEVKRPIEAVSAATDCVTWWRVDDDSVECFGPYRTTRGAIKPETYGKCKVVPSPEPKCGPRSR
jgi:hypothetical protein